MRQGVRTHGVEEDLEAHAKDISFSDPDGIAWELSSVSTRPDVQTLADLLLSDPRLPCYPQPFKLPLSRTDDPRSPTAPYSKHRFNEKSTIPSSTIDNKDALELQYS